MLKKWYIGKLPNGEAIFFNSDDMAKDLGVESFFFMPESEIPSGDGILKTDGVSKIWYEDPPPIPTPVDPIPEPDPELSLEEKVDQLESAFEIF